MISNISSEIRSLYSLFLTKSSNFTDTISLKDWSMYSLGNHRLNWIRKGVVKLSLTVFINIRDIAPLHSIVFCLFHQQSMLYFEIIISFSLLNSLLISLFRAFTNCLHLSFDFIDLLFPIFELYCKIIDLISLFAQL